MLKNTLSMRSTLGTTLAALLAVGITGGVMTPAMAAPSGTTAPANTVNLSTGRGTLVNLSAPMSDLFVADDKVADVQVRSSTQLYIFAKGPGETTVYATSKSGSVVYSANVRVGTNLSSVDSMLKLAMPDATIQATPMNGLMLLTGSVSTPDDVAEAERLVQAFVGKETQVVSRLTTPTPLQVNLQVRIAEVSRDFEKSVGINLLAGHGGFIFGQGSQRITQELNPLTPNNPDDLRNLISPITGGSSIGFLGKFLGLNLNSTLDLAENDGLITTLAKPNLTALSGETATFLAGGEIPIPVAQTLGTIAIEYKSYGVGLSFTPTVLANGRISMRIRPEVSELTSAGALKINGYEVPALTTRRAETTIELGSGQSFMIGGLLKNTHNNSVLKAPFLGDLPVIGALFRSKKFRRNESELVIIATPYLVKPVSDNMIRTPYDGYQSPNDVQAFIGGQNFTGKSGVKPPMPTMMGPRTIQSDVAGGAPAQAARGKKGKRKDAGTAPDSQPGFSF